MQENLRSHVYGGDPVWMLPRIGKDGNTHKWCESRQVPILTVADFYAWFEENQRRRNDFYKTKRKTAHFYMEQVLPETMALHETINRGSESLASFDVQHFLGLPTKTFRIKALFV